MKEENDIIQKFLDDELTSEELKVFKERMSKDKAFAYEVEAYLQRIAYLRAVKRLQESKTTKTVHFEPNRKHVQWYQWAAAITVLLVLSLSLYYLLAPQPKTATQLAQSYFSPADLVTTRSAEDTTQHTAIDQAFYYYNKEDYEKAIVNFNEALQDSIVDKDMIYFYQGNAYIALKQPKNAIITFRQVVRNDMSFYSEDGQWYLALSYLLNNQKDSAQIHLEHLLQDNPYPKLATKAENLLNEIK